MPNLALKTLPYLTVVYFLLMLIPTELYVQIGSIRMEIYRLFLVFVLLVFFSYIYSYRKYGLVGKCLLLYCVLCFFSFIINHGISGIQSGAILFLEVFIGYFIGLQLGGKPRYLIQFLRLVSCVFLILAPFAFFEAIDGYRLLHVLPAGITNVPVIDNLGDSYFRHGLHRASTVFSHPILYSICAVMFLPLIYLRYGKFLGSIFSIGFFSAMITSVTSAGFVMVIIQFILFCIKKLSVYIPSIFKLTVYSICVVYICLSFVSNRGPILLAIQFASLNPATAYTRYQQWLFAADDVANNPLWGIGFYEWSRPHWMQVSIDSFWLMTVLQNGYPALLALAVVFIVSIRSYWLAWRSTHSVLFFTFFCSMFSIIFAGFTVDFFDRAQLIIFLMLGVFNSFITPSSILKQEKRCPNG